MPVDAFFESSTRSETTDALVDAFGVAVRAMGFEWFHYFGFPTPETRGPSPDVVIVTQIPWPWFDHYDDERYEEIDPLGELVTRTRMPFLWTEVLDGMELSRKQARFVDDLHGARLLDGVTVPIHGPFGQVNGVCFAHAARGPLSQRTIHTARVLALQFHQTYDALAERKAPVSTALTAREREVLLHLSGGSSNAEVAARLGVTEHSVKYHLLNVCRKLNVNSRVAAVVKAIRLGLIVP